MRFAPIHNHSEFSALDGLSTMREIAERCEQIGAESCAISDHGVVSGHLEFDKVMRAHNIKPIFACELYHGVKTTFTKSERDQAHLLVGALTDEGLRNLWRLVDYASTDFRFVGRVNWTALAENTRGCFATSTCMLGLVSKQIVEDEYEALNKYLKIFKENFYIELHTYPTEDQKLLNLALMRVAQEKGIPMIYANDAHFAFPEQYGVHDTYIAMKTGESVYLDPADRKMWHPKALYIQSEMEIRENLSYLPVSVVDEALSNTHAIAEKASAGLPEVRRHLPVFIPKQSPWVEEDISANQLFMDLVAQGVENRYGDASDEVWDRVTTEAEVILDAGLEHYFLQTWDFCQYCDDMNIPRGPGRGSAAGSIVSYCLGITDVEPLQYGLIFERFYNAGRAKGFPDIDNDFPKALRKTVKHYLAERWGHDNVRSIGTIVRLKPKAACDKTFGSCGVTREENEALKEIVSHVPDLEILGPDSIGWHEDVDPGKTIYVWNHVGDEILQWLSRQAANRQDILTHWLNVVEMVCSRASHYGVHPSGVVVSDTPLPGELPCFYARKLETQATNFPMDDVDARQFVKQDLLGLRNLDTLLDWQSQMRQEGVAIEWSGLENEEHPEEMWEMLDQGLTMGIFQIEDGYARSLCEDIKPRSVEDLAIIISLNRPGPIRSGAPTSFYRRRFGLEDVTYDHPFLEDILEPTYGWFLYQEQVIQFFTKLGYDLSEADAIRKILGKKKPEEMQKLHEGKGEWEGRGYQQVAAPLLGDKADLIWRKLEDFAKYSFNKSHAIAYATIAFRTLYAKFIGWQNFLISCIRTNSEKAGSYVAEGRRVGIHTLPPDILRSDVDARKDGKDVLLGLYNVKGVGKAAAESIIRFRRDFDLTTPEKLGHVLETAGVQWKAKKEQAKAELKPFKLKSPKMILKSSQIDALWNAGAWDNYEEREDPPARRQKLELELLEIILTDTWTPTFERNCDKIVECDTYGELEKADDGEYLCLPGVISKLKATRTRKEGKAMGIVSIEYEGKEAEFVVFPSQWKAYKFLWKETAPGIFTLQKDKRGLHFEKGLLLK